MASLEHDIASGRYRVRFRVAGRNFKRSQKTTDEREARSVQGRIEETIRLVERGRILIPSNADLGTFILSDGKMTQRLTSSDSNVTTLEELFNEYNESRLRGTKADTTVEGEKIHQQHLKKYFGKRRGVQTLTMSDMQAYVKSRLRKRWGADRFPPRQFEKS